MGIRELGEEGAEAGLRKGRPGPRHCAVPDNGFDHGPAADAPTQNRGNNPLSALGGLFCIVALGSPAYLLGINT